MKKRTEKQPVDDLFARKLGNMSLPPSPDGFARLQARMGQAKPETRLVFWRNPAIQRSVAVAACLLLVCLVGWLYQSTQAPVSERVTVAVNKPAALTGKNNRYEQPKSADEVATTGTRADRESPRLTHPELTDRSVAERGKPVVSQPMKDNRQFAQINQTTREAKTSSPNAATGEPTKPTEQVAQTEVNTPSAAPTAEEPTAAATHKPAPIVERVLVVTIAEPEALLVARQTVEKPTGERNVEAVVADKPEKESKVGNLWQQVKRIRQGEVFARKDAGDDERGLLGRAYSGLKQTFDKDKSTKQ